MTLIVGLLSGTSADAVDAALVDFSAGKPELVGSLACPFDPQIRDEILALYTPGANEIDRMGALDNRLGEIFAEVTLQLLQQTGVPAADVQAIGCHGQTVRHRPHLGKRQRFTLQIGNPNVIAARTGITVISDFRRRDMACGGEGAPLAPAFHKAAFAAEQPRAVLNFGGIANLTCLPAAGPVTGFDVGPANALMDAWIGLVQGEDYDYNGNWAASGQVNAHLLTALLRHPYFARRPPKSTGREEFTLAWLQEELAPFAQMPAEDVQATLLQLSVVSIQTAVEQYCEPQSEVYVCGGGAHNRALMQGLRTALPNNRVESTAALGVHPDWVEAMAFAWLARQTLQNLPGNLPAVTGAESEAVLGTICPAGRAG